ncbi:MAG: hypothetical protein H0X66_10915 [Verrucomicrobia bacterium]|nr:hypothetical protein [Verrucomicrobiota bacterium]
MRLSANHHATHFIFVDGLDVGCGLRVGKGETKIYFRPGVSTYEGNSLEQFRAFIHDTSSEYAKTWFGLLLESQLPTERAAEILAYERWIGANDLLAEESAQVSGLFRVGRRGMGDLARPGEWIWEVRITDMPFSLSGLVWVNAHTRAVRIFGPGMDISPRIGSLGKSDFKVTKVTTNDVLVVKTGTGRAVVQFTDFGEHSANYRWQFRANESNKIETGTGQVITKHRVLPSGKLQSANKFVESGRIRFEWSYGGREVAYVYFYPAEHEFSKEGMEAFDKALR